MTISQNKKYHPILDYLDNLKWDGKPRMETLFIDYLGADDNEMVRIMTKKWLLSAVARIKIPGCKVEQMLVLSGPQGCGKTEILRILANAPTRNFIGKIGGVDMYYTNCPKMDDTDQKIYEKICNAWICGQDEFVGWKKTENARIKNFLSKTKETCRLASGLTSGTFPRHCVFAGTTNEDHYLKDYTDFVERRYFPIHAGNNAKNIKVFTLTQDYIDMVWAEVVYYFNQIKNTSLNGENKGNAWHLNGEEFDKLAELQRQYKTSLEDERFELLNEIFYEKKFVLNSLFEFNSYDDFLEQMNNKFQNRNGVNLDKIPLSYLSRYFTEVRKIKKLTPKYILNSGLNYTIRKIKYGEYLKKDCLTLKTGFRDLRGRGNTKLNVLEEKDNNMQNLFNI